MPFWLEQFEHGGQADLFIHAAPLGPEAVAQFTAVTGTP